MAKRKSPIKDERINTLITERVEDNAVVTEEDIIRSFKALKSAPIENGRTLYLADVQQLWKTRGYKSMRDYIVNGIKCVKSFGIQYNSCTQYMNAYKFVWSYGYELRNVPVYRIQDIMSLLRDDNELKLVNAMKNGTLNNLLSRGEYKDMASRIVNGNGTNGAPSPTDANADITPTDETPTELTADELNARARRKSFNDAYLIAIDAVNDLIDLVNELAVDGNKKAEFIACTNIIENQLRAMNENK